MEGIIVAALVLAIAFGAGCLSVAISLDGIAAAIRELEERK